MARLADAKLFAAIDEGDPEALAEALAAGADANAVSLLKEPALSYCTRYAGRDGNHRLMVKLLAAGADPFARWEGGESPEERLLSALGDGKGRMTRPSTRESLDVLRFHQERAILKKVPAGLLLSDRTGFTALHWAARDGDEDYVRRWIEARGGIAHKSDAGMTPIQVAAAAGQEGVVRLLHAVDPSWIESGQALEEAMLRSDRVMVETVLACGADADLALDPARRRDKAHTESIDLGRPEVAFPVLRASRLVHDPAEGCAALARVIRIRDAHGSMPEVAAEILRLNPAIAQPGTGFEELLAQTRERLQSAERKHRENPGFAHYERGHAIVARLMDALESAASRAAAPAAA